MPKQRLNEHVKRPVRPDQLFEGSICWYDFSSSVKGEFDGPRPVILLGRQPGLRMLRRLDLQVIPISSTPERFPGQSVSVSIDGKKSYAALDFLTTINPLKLRDFVGTLSKSEHEAVKLRLAKRLQDDTPRPVGRISRFRPRQILLVPTDRAPEGRAYVVLDNRNFPFHLDKLQAVPLPSDDKSSTEADCRIRSFGHDRISHLTPIGILDKAKFDEIRQIVFKRLALPASPQPNGIG